ncbi:hypothetical protein PgNI_05829, partial [Pyricularia grisea]|uniref:Uncharacterized protein n=1 Tax=Pyricularia grisea TaxID=148305 RepID=A0A6P8B7T9_PYRGI
LVKGLTLAPEKCWSFSAVRECKPEVVAIWRAILSSSWVGGIGCGRQPGNGHLGLVTAGGRNGRLHWLLD